MNADEWNTRYPTGTVVDAAPGLRREDGGAVIRTKTRSAAWTLGSGEPVVAVKGYPGGIHLDHIEVVGCTSCGATVGHRVPCPRLEAPPRCAYPADDDPGGFR